MKQSTRENLYMILEDLIDESRRYANNANDIDGIINDAIDEIIETIRNNG